MSLFLKVRWRIYRVFYFVWQKWIVKFLLYLRYRDEKSRSIISLKAHLLGSERITFKGKVKIFPCVKIDARNAPSATPYFFYRGIATGNITIGGGTVIKDYAQLYASMVH